MSESSESRLAASLDGPDGAPVLVLANPIGTTRAIWAAQVPVLERHFRLLRFELRGHGERGARSAAPPGPYSLAELGTEPFAGSSAAFGAFIAAFTEKWGQVIRTAGIKGE